MGRRRQTPVAEKKNRIPKHIDPQYFSDVDYVELVEIVRRSRIKTKSNAAYQEIEKRMKTKLQQIAFKFNIPGMNNEDIYQEALFALRYKAVKDYNADRGNDTGPYPFDKFAILCIRRHLATSLKASYQNKKKENIIIIFPLLI